MLRDTRLMMNMPITVEIADAAALPGQLEATYAHFAAVDRRFSFFRPDSEISLYNRGEITETQLSPELREIFTLAQHTKIQSHGYFDIRRPDGLLNPSGIVKGWAIRNAARLLRDSGLRHFYVDAGGDIQSMGLNADGQPWVIGIRNPFNDAEIIKAVKPQGRGMATSGSYVRGAHIYNPHRTNTELAEIISLTVLGKDVLEADRFATAAFAMGQTGINFIEDMPDLEGYAVARDGIATRTSGFGAFVAS